MEDVTLASSINSLPDVTLEIDVESNIAVDDISFAFDPGLLEILNVSTGLSSSFPPTANRRSCRNKLVV